MTKQQEQPHVDQLYFDGSAEPNPGGRMGAGHVCAKVSNSQNCDVLLVVGTPAVRRHAWKLFACL